MRQTQNEKEGPIGVAAPGPSSRIAPSDLTSKGAVTTMVRQTAPSCHVPRPGSAAHLKVDPVERAVAAADAFRAKAGDERADGSVADGSEFGQRPGSSWHLAKQVSALLNQGSDLQRQRRHVRYAQREVLWGTSSLERVRRCGRVAVQEGGVMIRNNVGVAHYAGVATCGSIWACPVCSAKIRAGRADDVSAATANWDRQGNTVLMAAFTAPHDMGMELKPLLSAISGAFRHCLSGRPWQRLKKRLGVVGQIRALEVTYGSHGWHPHLHVLIYVEQDLDAQGLAELTIHLRERWKTWITKQGYRPPHDLHGVDVQRCYSAEEAGQYIAKTQDGKSVGNEVTRGDMKRGRNASRTPFEILDDFRWTGDVQDLALWGEYERATHRRQAITWSAGLRALLLPEDQEERTDEELAEQEVGGEDVALLEPDTWRAVVRVPGLPAYLLEQVERGGVMALQQTLRSHGIPEALPVHCKGAKA